MLFKVGINYSGKIPLQSVALISEGHKACESQDVLRVLNTILRQHSVNKYSLSPLPSLRPLISVYYFVCLVGCDCHLLIIF